MGKSGNPAKRAVTSEPNDQIMVCWCDNGTVDGKFMEGVVYTLLTAVGYLLLAHNVCKVIR